MTDALAVMIYGGGVLAAWQLRMGIVRGITWPIDLGAAIVLWVHSQSKDRTDD